MQARSVEMHGAMAKPLDAASCALNAVLKEISGVGDSDIERCETLEKLSVGAK